MVLLSLGLVMAFSVSAFAVDVKVSADYYVGGLYLNKVNVNSTDSVTVLFPADPTVKPPSVRYLPSDISTAFFYQRLRVGTDFIVSPGLKLVTRFDALERIWGGARSNVWQVNATEPTMSAGTRAESENIAFDVAYIDYTSPIGKFEVGYMPDSTWGTVFGNDSTGPTVGLIKWSAPVGPVILLANFAKLADNSSSAVSTQSWYWYNNVMANKTDRDTDSYRAGFIYPFKNEKANGQAGALFIYSRDASNRGRANWVMPFPGAYGQLAFLSRSYKIMPYFKANIGPVALQGEINYQWGDAVSAEYGVPFTNSDKRIDSLSAFLDATAKFGMFTVGGTFAYVQGDDNIMDGVVHDANTGGIDFNPCLLMFNYDTVQYWIGGINGWNLPGLNTTSVGGPMKNAWFLQGRVGASPTPKLDLLASLSWATADKKPEIAPYSGVHFPNGGYGFEIDLTGTYKITNNLSYMLGAGYLFTGDYFKGYGVPGMDVQDDFILINKLTLSF
jgi:hypothetical protein